jgi:hypothetical protein
LNWYAAQGILWCGRIQHILLGAGCEIQSAFFEDSVVFGLRVACQERGISSRSLMSAVQPGRFIAFSLDRALLACCQRPDKKEKRRKKTTKPLPGELFMKSEKLINLFLITTGATGLEVKLTFFILGAMCFHNTLTYGN